MWTLDESVGPRAPVGASFDLLSLSQKRTGALHIPLSVDSRVNLFILCQAFIIPSGVLPSVGLSVFRRAFHPPLGSPSSVRRSSLHRALCLPSGILPSVEFSIRRSIVCWLFRPPLSVPPSIGISAFRQESRPPLGSLLSVGLSVFRLMFRPLSGSLYSLWCSAVCLFLHSAISRPLRVLPSFEKFEDCVLHKPTGCSFNNLRNVSSTRRRGPASSNMRNTSYISRRDLASSNLRTMSSISGLISCTLSMS